MLRAIQLTDPTDPIDLIVHTPGGLVLAAEQIARALLRHPAKVTVFVPHYAMSGGTLIALAADEIVMDPNAVLGPVDPQLGQSPAASIAQGARAEADAEVDDQTIILADMRRRHLPGRETVRDLMAERMDRSGRPSWPRARAGTWTHDYPITRRGRPRAGPAGIDRDAGGDPMSSCSCTRRHPSAVRRSSTSRRRIGLRTRDRGRRHSDRPETPSVPSA